MINAQLLETTHLFYNPDTNIMVSVQFRKAYGLYEVRRSNVTYVQYMSMDSILEAKGTEPWEFTGVV